MNSRGVCVCLKGTLNQKGARWAVAQQIVCSPTIYEALGSVPSTQEMVADRS